MEDYLSADQRLALVNQALGYVSLHRAEGYGLTMAESMALGRPVIATGYSGNLDFMDEHNSILVPYRLISSEGNPTYPEHSVWADPDLEAATAALREIWENPEWANELGRRGQESVRRDLSVEKTAAFIQERVDAILATRKRGKFPQRRFVSSVSGVASLSRAKNSRALRVLGPMRGFTERALLRLLSLVRSQPGNNGDR